MLVFYILLSTNILGIVLGELFVAETEDNTFYLADLDADSAAQLVGAEGNVAPGANEEEELIQKLGEYLDATEDADAEGTGAELTGAEGAGAEGVGAKGLEAEGLEAEVLGAEGVGADGLEAEGLEAEGLEAEGLEAEGLEAEGLEAEGLEAEGLEAEGLEAESTGAEDVGAEALEAEGLGAEGTGAEGLEAEGLEAEGTGAEGTGAEGTEAEGLEAEGAGAEGEEGNDYAADTAGGSNRKTSKECIATGGPGKGKPCIFPFHWVKTGKTYTECTTDGGAEFWCSTKIDELGDHLSGNWGECPAHCLKDADQAILETTGVRKSCKGEEATCLFPLTLGGYSYRGCVDSPSHNHGKCFGRHFETGKAMETGCTKNCPRDLLITNLDHTMAHILKALLMKPIITNKIKRVPLMTKKASCQTMLRKKFSQSDKKLHPKQLQSAKSWDEAFKMACTTSSYCMNSKSPACKSTKITLRKTQVKDKSDDDVEYKADCKISCGFPDDPTSDYNNLVH